MDIEDIEFEAEDGGTIYDMNPFLHVLKILSSGDIPCVAVGGFAVVMHGMNRFTPDLNLVCDLSGDNPARIVECLQAANLFTDPKDLSLKFLDDAGREEIRAEHKLFCLPFEDADIPSFRVDLFLSHPLSFERLKANANQVEFTEGTFSIASIDDLIALKEISGRGQDKADIDNLNYIKSFLPFLGDEQKCLANIPEDASPGERDQISNLITFSHLGPDEKAAWLLGMLEQLGKFCML